MRFIDRVHRLNASLRRRLFGLERPPSLTALELTAHERANAAAHGTGDIHRMFFGHDGRIVHKWVHYLDVYERHFQTLRGKPVRMLEIGVSKGGSLEVWRKYLGPEAVIFGIDIDPACAGRVDPPNVVRIGSQDDPAFLRQVVAEMGGLDIVLDDGSHVSSHQRLSFDVLFELLSDGGLYVIEDMHTAYMPSYEGGYRRRGTAIELVKGMIDDMHGWYHARRRRTPARDWIAGIHVYDSIVVIEKRRRGRPGHMRSPG